jgi:hypothetical protein
MSPFRGAAKVKGLKSPFLSPLGNRSSAVNKPQHTVSPGPYSAGPSTAAPVLSECGISLSTLPFEFPAPSEDTAGEFTSRLPSHGTSAPAAAGFSLPRIPAPQSSAPPWNLGTTDPDEVSCRHRPLPAMPARTPMRRASAATFSSGAGGQSSAGLPQHSTASLASWLPGKGTSSMQATACADDSDCEDDAVSNRWSLLPPAAPPAAASPAFSMPRNTQAQTGPRQATRPAGSASNTVQQQARLAPPSATSEAAALACMSPVCGAMESVEAAGAADLTSLLLKLAQGGGRIGHTAQQVGHKAMQQRT